LPPRFHSTLLSNVRNAVTSPILQFNYPIITFLPYYHFLHNLEKLSGKAQDDYSSSAHLKNIWRKRQKQAIEHHEKSLNLWKDADLGISEVEEAKKRLAGLKQQT
jgi:hypothetical protein